MIWLGELQTQISRIKWPVTPFWAAQIQAYDSQLPVPASHILAIPSLKLTRMSELSLIAGFLQCAGLQRQQLSQIGAQCASQCRDGRLSWSIAAVTVSAWLTIVCPRP